MALKNFRSPRLPDAPREYDVAYMRDFIGVLELYFNKLDSPTPNIADSYTADEFIGGAFSGSAKSYTTAEKTALTADEGTIIYDTDLDKLCVKTAGGWQTVTSV